MIPQELERRFAKPVRSRGASYFGEGRVRIEHAQRAADDGVLLAGVVRGSEWYEVALQRTRGRLRMTCDCPFAEDAWCKHMYALLLAADEQAFFNGGGEPSTSPTQRAKAGATAPEWRSQLRQLRRNAGTQPLPETGLTRALLYLFDSEHLARTGEVVIEAVSGTAKQKRRFTDEQWLRSSHEDDRDIAQRLLGTSRHNPQTFSYYAAVQPVRRFVIPPVLYDSLLRRICDTGRCRLHGQTPPADEDVMLAFDAGGAWTPSFTVLRDAATKGWRLSADFVRGDERIPLTDARTVTALGLMLIRATLRLYTVGEAWPLLYVLRKSGTLLAPRNELFDFAAELTLSGAAPLALPEGAAVTQVRPQPVPRLIVGAPASTYDRSLPTELRFDYDGIEIAHDAADLAVIDHTQHRIVHRSMDAESAALQRLFEAGATTRRDWGSTRDHVVVQPRRLDTLVHTLVAKGWDVVAHNVRYRMPGRSDARIASGIDWFELNGGVEYGGQRVPIAPLLAALQRGERTIQLDDGSRGILPAEWLHRYASAAALGTAAENGAIRFTRSQTALLDALLATLPETPADEAFEHARAQLRQFTHVQPIEPPASFEGSLRAYQKDGLAWFGFLRAFALGGCLADDMGLGKTVQVLAMLEQRRIDGGGPSIVVVPKSLVFNWRSEAARFTPALRIYDYTGVERRRTALDPASFDVLITTYGTLRRDAADLRSVEFDYAILDEAQAIKNATSASAKAARLLRARHRLALSGTPIENNLNELWSLFEFLNPGMFGAARAFSAFRSTGAGGDPDSRVVLARALRPVLLRRTKQQVAPELPARIEQTLVVELEKQQRVLYDSLRDHYRTTLLGHIDKVGVKRASIQILEALLRLRQAACHPALVDKRRTRADSAKLDVLLDHIAEVTAEGHRVLVFSQFTSFLALARERLDEAGITYEYLDGSTRDRQARVERFQADAACPVFLISLRAGGHGLNLTAADYVFILDPWWNPAVEAQAIDRTHRIGQDKHVIALRLIARDTVEEKVLELQRTKRALADAILGEDAGPIARMTREDVALLLD